MHINICYLQVVTNSGDEIANRAIELLKEVNTNLGPRLQCSLLEFHDTYISECLDRLKAHYDTVSVLLREGVDCNNEGNSLDSVANRLNHMGMDEVKKEDMLDELMMNRLKAEAVKMCRVMKVLQEYIGECDGDFTVERKILPLHR